VVPVENSEILTVLPVVAVGDAPAASLVSRAALGAAGWGFRKIVGKVLFLILFIPVGGIGLIFVSCTDRMPLHQSSPIPQSISCSKLLAEGPGENLHIALTDFKLDTNRRMSDSLFEEFSGNKVWVAIEPAGNTPQAGVIRLLLEKPIINSSTGLAELQQGGRIEGMLYRGTSSVNLREALRLHRRFPNTDWEACWLLRYGEQPPSAPVTYALITLGVLMILAGVPIWRFAWSVWRDLKHTS
jgi:hypothetical protein